MSEQPQSQRSLACAYESIYHASSPIITTANMETKATVETNPSTEDPAPAVPKNASFFGNAYGWLLIGAGVCAVPALSFMALVSAPITAILVLPSVFLITVANRAHMWMHKEEAKDPKKPSQPRRRHLVVTGGSSGIGYAIAQQCNSMTKKGDPSFSRISIVARDESKLEQCAEQLKASSSLPGSVRWFSVDVTDPAALESASSRIFNPKDKGGSTLDEGTKETSVEGATKDPVVASEDDEIHLVCCAGVATPGHFEQFVPTQFASQVAVNQLGAIYTVQAFLPYFFDAVTKKPKRGTITFCASVLAQMGLYGYSTYCPAKFALRGFAETLSMEIREYLPQVCVCVAFPNDTETPGFQLENLTKPLVTHKISETAGLSQPAEIAKTMLHAILGGGSPSDDEFYHPPFFIYTNLDGYLVSNLTAGMSPVYTTLDTLSQVVLGGAFRLIALFYIVDWYRLIHIYCDKKGRQAGEAGVAPPKVTPKVKEP
jgi:3-dehydrosphinganine reductase